MLIFISGNKTARHLKKKHFARKSVRLQSKLSYDMQKGEHFFRVIRTLPEDFIQILHVCKSKKILHFEKQLLLLQLLTVFTIRNSLASPSLPRAHSCS